MLVHTVYKILRYSVQVRLKRITGICEKMTNKHIAPPDIFIIFELTYSELASDELREMERGESVEPVWPPSRVGPDGRESR